MKKNNLSFEGHLQTFEAQNLTLIFALFVPKNNNQDHHHTNKIIVEVFPVCAYPFTYSTNIFA